MIEQELFSMYIKSSKRCKNLDDFKKYLLSQQTHGYAFWYPDKKAYEVAIKEKEKEVDEAINKYKDLLPSKWK